ncbi:MAG: glycosyltransferase family 4 protein [Candidatus Fonsibacter sp.]|nr:glycosyltransferase family 4 protein [Pelagibacterales bacterium]
MDKKVRLLQVIPKLDFGGAETGCKDIARYIEAHGHFSSIICNGGRQLSFLDLNKIKVIKLPVHSKNLILIILNIFLIIFFIKKLNINIVHVRSRAPAWSCYYACKFTKTKMISTFHGTYNFSNSLKKFYNSIMLKGDGVIAGSKFISDHIKSNYSVKIPIYIIERGIDVHFFNKNNINIESKENIRERWGLNNNFLILLPGRLTNWKGQMFFLKTLVKMKNENLLNNINSVILGDNQGREEYKNNLTKIINENFLQNNVKLINHESHMPSAYLASDLVLSASIEPEAFGRVVVEGMAMEKPVLASNIGGSVDTVQNKVTGFLFQSENEQSLIESLLMIKKLDKSELDRICKNARERVIEKFNVTEMCSKTLEIYKSLV